MFKTRMTFEQSEQGWLKSLTDGMLLFQQLNGAGCREPKGDKVASFVPRAKLLFRSFLLGGMQELTRGLYKRLVISSHALLSFGHIYSSISSRLDGIIQIRRDDIGKCRQMPAISPKTPCRDPMFHPPLKSLTIARECPATSCDGSRQRISGNHSFSIGIRRLPVANASGELRISAAW